MEDDVIEDDDEAAIAAITLAELRVGVLLASERDRSTRLVFVDELLGVVPVLEYGTAEAEAHAELLVHVRHQGRPRGAHHLLIAATAKATRRIVVTADEAAFADLPGVQTRTHR